MLGAKIAKNMTVRNVPEDVMAAMKEKADRNQRPLEAEARMAFQAWVTEPEIPQRLRDTSERLNLAFKLASESPNARSAGYSAFTTAHLAEGIGEQFVLPVDEWFAGIAEPSLSTLERIAHWCGVVPEWLKTGIRTPYQVSSVTIPESPIRGAFWLLGVTEQEPDPAYHHIRLVRRAGERGDFLVIREKGITAEVLMTPYVISNDTGTGGRIDLQNLCLVLQALHHLWIGNYLRTSITSHIVNDDLWSRITSGKENPSALIHRSPNASWWEDIWDSSMTTQGNGASYWEGFIPLATSLQKANASAEDGKIIRELRSLKDCHVEKWLKSSLWINGR